MNVKQTARIIALLGIFLAAGVAHGANPSGVASSGSELRIADMAWDDSNIDTLQSFESPWEEGDAPVVQFVCEQDPSAYAKTCGMRDFQWVDLAGNHEYQLVITSYFSPKSQNWLRIYWRDSSGTISKQQFSGYLIRAPIVAKTGPLAMDIGATALQELNGDGKVELVIFDTLASHDSGGPLGLHALALWPKIYRLENRKYVEASRDFPGFYDKYILPRLNDLLGKSPSEAAHEISTLPPPNYGVLSFGALPDEELAAVEMARDKILRILGRNPNAGEEKAREWMKSDSPVLRHDAVLVFTDMGNHDADLRQATSQETASEQQVRALKGPPPLK